MGVVYEAVHLKVEQRVALKCLHPTYAARADWIQRFSREARASFALAGPHVLRTLDVDETAEGVPFIVSELLHGHDVGKELAERGGRLPVAQAIDYILQACAGVASAHAAGIVHRDIKPTNLFLARTGDGITLKVFDFGISSRPRGTTAKSRKTGEYLGSPRYAAPEQAVAASTVDHRADIWSLGVVLYRMLTGVIPFDVGDNGEAATMMSRWSRFLHDRSIAARSASRPRSLRS